MSDMWDHTVYRFARGRIIPLGILPTWDSELMVAEISRLASKGCDAVSLPELPHIENLPSYHDLAFLGPVFDALCDHDTVMCTHIGQGRVRTAPPIRALAQCSARESGNGSPRRRVGRRRNA
jgi:hypothetical protein